MDEMIIKNVTKIYDKNVVAVKDFSLKCKGNDFLVLVGPSGCGKSTVLRMIAGLEDISYGEIFFDDVKLNGLHPSLRSIAMVFQNYALYPNKTVFDNMAFSLKLNRTPYIETVNKVYKSARDVRLENLLDRYPRFLSGGQRQRTAIGRSLVREPKAFLLDEPLSNLDASLRERMRAEILRLYKNKDKLFILVTHDQTEAMTLATKMAVINDGRLLQFGESTEIYDNPKNLFVARFIGSPPMNVFAGKLNGEEFTFLGLRFNLTALQKKRILGVGDCLIGFRPEHAYLSSNGVLAKVVAVENLGHEKLIYLYAYDSEIVIRADKRSSIKVGDETKVNFLGDNAYFFDKQTKFSLINRTQKYFSASVLT